MAFTPPKPSKNRKESLRAIIRSSHSTWLQKMMCQYQLDNRKLKQ